MAMVEAQPTTQVTSKRQRDETLETQTLEDPNKRQKSYNHILTLLDEDEEEPIEDLSSLITTFQQELASSDEALSNPNEALSEVSDYVSEGYNSSSSGSSSPTSSFLKEEEESCDDVERVMRHLLEASDDELGIPQREIGNGFEEVDGDEFGFGDNNGLLSCDGLWELEDEAANYYALMQSELFM